MNDKSVHEPEAHVMSVEDVVVDAQELAAVLRRNLIQVEPAVELRVPLSAFLAALDNLDRDELLLLQRRVEEKLTT